MKYFYDNKIDGSAVALAAASADAEFPVENLQNIFPSKFYKTGISITSEYIIVDAGVAIDVNTFILYAHTLTSSDTSLRLQANSTSSWTSTPVDVNVTYSSGVIVYPFSETKTYRFWKFSFSKTSATESRQIGRMYLGTYVTVKAPLRDGIQDQNNDLSEVTRSSGNQKYANIKGQYRSFSLTCIAPSDVDKVIYEIIAARVGIHTPFFVQISAIVFPEYLYTYFTALQSFKRKGSTYYTFSVGLEEAL